MGVVEGNTRSLDFSSGADTCTRRRRFCGARIWNYNVGDGSGGTSCYSASSVMEEGGLECRA